MGNFTKLFAQWKTPFWSDRGTQWLATTKHSPEGPVEFHDLGKYIPGYNTLFTYVVGHQSKVSDCNSPGTSSAAEGHAALLRVMAPARRMKEHAKW